MGKGRIVGEDLFEILVGCVRVRVRQSDYSDSWTTLLTIVFAMACIGSSRLCARVEKLCQFGHFGQLRRKVSTTCVKSRPGAARASNMLFQHCQVPFMMNSLRVSILMKRSRLQYFALCVYLQNTIITIPNGLFDTIQLEKCIVSFNFCNFITLFRELWT